MVNLADQRSVTDQPPTLEEVEQCREDVVR